MESWGECATLANACPDPWMIYDENFLRCRDRKSDECLSGYVFINDWRMCFLEEEACPTGLTYYEGQCVGETKDKCATYDPPKLWFTDYSWVDWEDQTWHTGEEADVDDWYFVQPDSYCDTHQNIAEICDWTYPPQTLFIEGEGADADAYCVEDENIYNYCRSKGSGSTALWIENGDYIEAKCVSNVEGIPETCASQSPPLIWFVFKDEATEIQVCATRDELATQCSWEG